MSKFDWKKHQELQSQACLSFWYPKLPTSILMPKTEIIRLEDHLGPSDCLGDSEHWENWGRRLSQLEEAVHDSAESVGGYPLFLRTGHTSAKFAWRDSCFVSSKEEIRSHVQKIADVSVGFVHDLPTDVWVVREYLAPKEGEVVATGLNGLPLRREFRVFTKDKKPCCVHPYWPLKAVLERLPMVSDWDGCRVFQDLAREIRIVAAEDLVVAATKAAEDLPGDWSVDFLWHDNDWWLTDMAPAALSWHDPRCEHVS